MEKEVIVSEPNPSISFSDARIICRVCQKQFSKYTCPRCNTRYCSVQCYKKHSLRCTESFMRENVIEEMRQVQPGDETRRKMLDILKRVHSEEEIQSDEEDDCRLSEEIVQKVISGDEVRLEDLSPEEIKQFQRAMASGELSKLIEPWTPWWTKPSARSISLSPEGCQLVSSLDEHVGTMEHSASISAPYVNEIPVGPATPLQPIKQLARGEPSPFLVIHLVDILYSYCFTLRLYNGDWQSDSLGAATVVLSVSKVLGSDARPETMTEALGACLEETCSVVYRHAGGFKFAVGLLDDVIVLLSLGSAALICLLCDLQKLLQAGERMLMSEKMGKRDKKVMRSAEKKVYFLMCWVHEQPGEVWSSLTGLIEMEKASLSQLSPDGGTVKAERNIQQSKDLIKEF